MSKLAACMACQIMCILDCHIVAAVILSLEVLGDARCRNHHYIGLKLGLFDYNIRLRILTGLINFPEEISHFIY